MKQARGEDVVDRSFPAVRSGPLSGWVGFHSRGASMSIDDLKDDEPISCGTRKAPGVGTGVEWPWGRRSFITTSTGPVKAFLPSFSRFSKPNCHFAELPSRSTQPF